MCDFLIKNYYFCRAIGCRMKVTAEPYRPSDYRQIVGLQTYSFLKIK